LSAQLNGIVPDPSLDYLVKNPEQFNNADRQVSATVVAVQIVGIENIRRRYSPEDTYYEMRRLNAVVERVAHKLQGLKLRGYRDGFCVVFGDQLRKGSSSKWHTELALQAAAEIHLQNAQEVESAVNGKRPVFVLRIGVSSARVLLGNAGDASALDVTVIGEAYDDARRFEKACEVNSVLFGRMTRDLLVKIDPSSAAFTRKVINMDKTGGSDMQEVFEFDPFFQNGELRKQAMTALRMSAKFERKDERFAASSNSGIVVDTNFGDAQMINYSRNGIGLMMKAPLANGTTVRVGIRSTNPILAQRLSNRSLNDLHAEVRWSRPSGEEQLMGLKYKSIEEADRDFLLQCLIEHHEALEPRRA
jgi:class 3 adenylate cyclase